MVYVSPDCGLRRKLWEALDITSLGTEGPWLSAGDYNSVMSVDEVSLPTHYNCHRNASFNDWVFDQLLIWDSRVLSLLGHEVGMTILSRKLV